MKYCVLSAEAISFTETQCLNWGISRSSALIVGNCLALPSATVPFTVTHSLAYSIGYAYLSPSKCLHSIWRLNTVCSIGYLCQTGGFSCSPISLLCPTEVWAQPLGLYVYWKYRSVLDFLDAVFIRCMLYLRLLSLKRPWLPTRALPHSCSTTMSTAVCYDKQYVLVPWHILLIEAYWAHTLQPRTVTGGKPALSPTVTSVIATGGRAWKLLLRLNLYCGRAD